MASYYLRRDGVTCCAARPGSPTGSSWRRSWSRRPSCLFGTGGLPSRRSSGRRHRRRAPQGELHRLVLCDIGARSGRGSCGCATACAPVISGLGLRLALVGCDARTPARRSGGDVLSRRSAEDRALRAESAIDPRRSKSAFELEEVALEGGHDGAAHDLREADHGDEVVLADFAVVELAEEVRHLVGAADLGVVVLDLAR